MTSSAIADQLLPRVPVLDSHMAFPAMGDRATGPAVLFLHSNPTSSYIWRDIMPRVAPDAYVVAPDLVGFDQSGKPDVEYDDALCVSTYPKLLLVGAPGALVSRAQAEGLRDRVADLELVQLASGRHYLQEEHLAEIGDTVARLVRKASSEEGAHG